METKDAKGGGRAPAAAAKTKGQQQQFGRLRCCCRIVSHIVFHREWNRVFLCSRINKPRTSEKKKNKKLNKTPTIGNSFRIWMGFACCLSNNLYLQNNVILPLLSHNSSFNYS